MIKPFSLSRIAHIWNVDHPESISVDAQGQAYTTGTGGQVYRLHLETNTAEMFASTAPRRVLGQAIDADGNLYCGDCHTGTVVRIAPDGRESSYATGPVGRPFICTNYPAFDSNGNLYLSDSGDFSDDVNGHIYKIPPGGGQAVLWFPDPLNTPNGVALDADERYLYFAETWGEAVSRIVIEPDGSAGELQCVGRLPKHVPDGIAFDEEGRLWIACHRPDAIRVLDPDTGRIDTFAEDWRGRELRGPTDVAFAGPDLDILLASSLDNLCVHRFDNLSARGLRLRHPKIVLDMRRDSGQNDA